MAARPGLSLTRQTLSIKYGSSAYAASADSYEYLAPSMNTPEQSQLGKTSAYADQYAPSLLFPIPRQTKRDEIGITAQLPFWR